MILCQPEAAETNWKSLDHIVKWAESKNYPMKWDGDRLRVTVIENDEMGNIMKSHNWYWKA